MPRVPARRRRRAPLRSLVAAAVLTLQAGGLPQAVAAPDPPPPHRPPVEAPVADPFRPPEGAFGAGNRGIQYDTAPGAEVKATADGTVTFAGAVAGSLHVTVLHEGGLRTSYSFLAEVRVVAGQRVRQGQVVGTTVDDLHLGARIGDAYLDPASLFTAGPPRVHLVPFEDPLPGGAAGERSAIRQLIGGLGGALGGLGGAAQRLAGGLGRAASLAMWLQAEGPQLLRTLGHYANRFAPPLATVSWLLTAQQAFQRARQASTRECTSPGRPPPPPEPGRRVALLVGGLGSTSDSAAIDDVDTGGLGYRPEYVLRFSYAGGRTPDPSDGIDVASSEYGPADTQVDLRQSAVELADLVEDVVRAEPDAPIDLYAHSQGGLVVRLALIELERRHGASWLARLGLVATLGTPHGGADLATAVHATGSTSAGSNVLDVVGSGLRLGLDDDATSIAQLSETSDVVAELARSPIPDTVTAVSVAARGDLVVPVPRTRAPGATEVVVPLGGAGAHDSLPGSPEAHRELALALAGLPPTCQSMQEALIDQAAGEAVSAATDLAGAAAWIAAARQGIPIGG